MHESSMNRMREFIDEFLDENEYLKILDVGSWCKNAEYPSYKSMFNKPKWQYQGVDLRAGCNVDIVAKDVYDWGIEPLFYDVIISGQCLEHVKDVKNWIQQINKCLKPNGIVCIIAPWKWHEHRHPIDCWRILPDGMKFLLKDVCEFEIKKVFMQEIDCIGIAQKAK